MTWKTNVSAFTFGDNFQRKSKREYVNHTVKDG